MGQPRLPASTDLYAMALALSLLSKSKPRWLLAISRQQQFSSDQQSKTMTQVHGHCDSRFGKVQDHLNKHIYLGNELGASICVNIDGKDVVDLWGGYMDSSRSRPWTQDTLAPVWSTSKTITNLAALILIDRGLLDAHAKVAKYWPEFAANGKEDVEVRHILSHATGVPSWDAPITVEEIYDIPRATKKLAAQAPWWKPGTASGYHLFTQGHMVGELVRRITGKSLGQFIDEEIAGPLCADFRLGAQEKDWPRIADTIMSKPAPAPRDFEVTGVMARAFMGTPVKPEYSMTPEFRRTELGAANGFSNARAVARILSMISLGGELDGKRWLSPSTIDLIFREQSNGMDLVLPTPVRLGIGFGLTGSEASSWLPNHRICFWGGWGGSIAIMDLDKRMTITYAMNSMENGTLGNARTLDYVKAIYEALE